MKIVEAHQVPKGNVSPGIFSLPCIDGCAKSHANGDAYYFTLQNVKPRLAYAGDWVCKDSKGIWLVLTEKEYRKETGK